MQTQSGERSFAVTTQQIENLPITRGNFTSLTAFTPGVVAGGRVGGGTRLGGAGQNNIMMDGISAMDTGNNGQMLQPEHRVDRRGEDPHAGLSGRIRPVERPADHGGDQERHEPVPGRGLRAFTDSDWNETSWVREKNGDPTPKTSQQTYGYSFGGPVGKPGGTNKLFFFYAHEYRPTTTAINNGNVIRCACPPRSSGPATSRRASTRTAIPFPPLSRRRDGGTFPTTTIPGRTACIRHRARRPQSLSPSERRAGGRE